MHFSYQKAYLVNEVSSGQFNQPSLENEDGGQRGYQFKRHDTYDSYRRYRLIVKKI